MRRERLLFLLLMIAVTALLLLCLRELRGLQYGLVRVHSEARQQTTLLRHLHTIGLAQCGGDPANAHRHPLLPTMPEKE